MSTLSMTGFGRGSAETGGFRAEAELSSVNRKQFDCAVSLPAGLSGLEEKCRRLVAAGLTGDVAVDAEFVRNRVATLRAIAAAAGVPAEISLADLARMPDVLSAVSSFPRPDDAWPAVEAAVSAAVASHRAMREREGAALRRDLEGRVAALRTLRDRIAARAPLVPAAYRDALARRVAELGSPLSPDDPALAREIALFADRCDVSEELTRLAAHLDHALALFEAPEPAGRKLDFLAQEMHRESNTIGSKANDAAISSAVIEAKALVETFREQVQNLE